jgi:hypothetical protein
MKPTNGEQHEDDHERDAKEETHDTATRSPAACVLDKTTQSNLWIGPECSHKQPYTYVLCVCSYPVKNRAKIELNMGLFYGINANA